MNFNIDTFILYKSELDEDYDIYSGLYLNFIKCKYFLKLFENTKPEPYLNNNKYHSLYKITIPFDKEIFKLVLNNIFNNDEINPNNYIDLLYIMDFLMVNDDEMFDKLLKLDKVNDIDNKEDFFNSIKTLNIKNSEFLLRIYNIEYNECVITLRNTDMVNNKLEIELDNTGKTRFWRKN